MHERIIEIARADPRVTGGADIGSSITGTQDRWSDIDITFGIKDGLDIKTVLDEWTALLDSEFGLAHYFDVPRPGAIYRVMLFVSGLEMDLSVATENEFGPRAPNFRLIFGSAVERTHFPQQVAGDLIGWGWHHALHANSAIARGRYWQAVHWMGTLRDLVISLRCIRHGIPSTEQRTVDQLPAEELATLDGTLVRSVDASELRRALAALTREFLREVRQHDPNTCVQLERTLFGILNREWYA